MQFTIIVINPKYGQLYYSLKKRNLWNIFISANRAPIEIDKLNKKALNTIRIFLRIDGHPIKVTVVLYKLQSVFTNYGHPLQVTVIFLPITVILVLCYGHLENILIMIYGHLNDFFKSNFPFHAHFSEVISDFRVILL